MSPLPVSPESLSISALTGPRAVWKLRSAFFEEIANAWNSPHAAQSLERLGLAELGALYRLTSWFAIRVTDPESLAAADVEQVAALCVAPRQEIVAFLRAQLAANGHAHGLSAKLDKELTANAHALLFQLRESALLVENDDGQCWMPLLAQAIKDHCRVFKQRSASYKGRISAGEKALG